MNNGFKSYHHELFLEQEFIYNYRKDSSFDEACSFLKKVAYIVIFFAPTVTI